MLWLFFNSLPHIWTKTSKNSDSLQTMIGYRKYARGHFIPWHALFLAMERVTNSKAYMRVVFLTDVGIKG